MYKENFGSEFSTHVLKCFLSVSGHFSVLAWMDKFMQNILMIFILKISEKLKLINCLSLSYGVRVEIWIEGNL